METKVCNRCGKEKPITEFCYRKKEGVYRNPCKECNMTSSEKAACCGCHERLEWERATKEAMITKTSGYDRKVIYNQIEEIMSLVRDLEDDLPGGNKTLETLSEKVVYFKYLMQETAAIDKDGEYYACRYRYKDDDIIRNVLKCHAGEPYWQL